MSTDDSKEEDGQGNGGREHDLAPGDYGENKTDGAEEGNRGEPKKHTEEEKGPEEEEVSSVMLMPGDVTKEKDTYKGNVPPPPIELYHGAQAQVTDMINGKSINFIKISYKKNLKRMKGQLVSAGKLIQDLLGCLQKSSDTLMLAPIGNRGNYIDQPVHVPLTNAVELRQYFSYTLEREEVRGVFVVRSEKSLWHLKQNPIVRQYLLENDVWLSGTRWLTEKRKETFFISGVHQTLANKEDLMTAIRDNMEGDAHFSVYPGRRNVGDREGKTTVRAPIVDLLLEDYEQGVSKLQGAFANARRNKDIRLKNMHLVPLRPSMTVSRELIREGQENKINLI